MLSFQLTLGVNRPFDSSCYLRYKKEPIWFLGDESSDSDDDDYDDNTIGIYVAPGLHIDLHGNPFLCDRRMCWLKRGQEEGWIHYEWYKNGYNADLDLKPRCSNFPDIQWEDVELGCED